MKKKLSICIPTFNRAEILEGLLHKLIYEMKYLEKEVEICISDNASTDETHNVIKSIIRNHKSISLKYKKNDNNLGFDKNCELALRMGEGQYKWIFSDYILDGTLRKILIKLDLDKPDLVFVNYKILLDNKELCSAARSDLIETNTIFKVAKKINLANTMVSSIIYSSDAMSKVDLEKPNGTFWYHFILFYNIIDRMPEARILYYGEPVIVQKGLTIEASRKEKSYEYDGLLDFYVDAYFSLLKRIGEKEIFEKLGIIEYCESLLIRQLTYYRIGNVHQNLRVKLRIIKHTKEFNFSIFDRILAFIILITPRYLLSVALKVRNFF